MIRMALCALLSVSINGCASFNSNIYQVDCGGYYSASIGLHKRSEFVRVSFVRIDKNNTLWIKPRDTLNVHFSGGQWQSPKILHDYTCSGKDYGLRGKAL